MNIATYIGFRAITVDFLFATLIPGAMQRRVLCQPIYYHLSASICVVALRRQAGATVCGS